MGFKLPVTSPNLRGFRIGHRGHSVNHLIISRLGDQEIALCSCDDGDVLGFYTDTFANAVKNRDINHRGSLADACRPFFHINVRLSAWGLAVHEEARIIAISANTHLITVFAFALSLSKPDSSSDAKPVSSHSSSEEENEWVSREIYAPGGWTYYNQTSPPEIRQAFIERSRDVCAVLNKAHDANIPTISFCNTGEDPNGRFLLSADVVGQMVVWDLFHLEPLRGFRPDVHLGGWELFSIRGWSVQWLDRRSFRTADPNKAFRPGTGFYADISGDQERSVLTLPGADGIGCPTEVWDPLRLRRDDINSAYRRTDPLSLASEVELGIVQPEAYDGRQTVTDASGSDDDVSMAESTAK